MFRFLCLAILVLVVPDVAGAQSAPVRSMLERRNEKLVRQQFDLSCGAAALATFLRYQHGEDFSERDDKNWLKHTVTWVDDAGKTTIDYRPVILHTLTDDVESVPPKARVY